MTQAEAHAYVNRIRNQRKRAYAKTYLAYLESRKQGEFPYPSSDAPLSSMAQQAIWMHLDPYEASLEAGNN